MLYIRAWSTALWQRFIAVPRVLCPIVNFRSLPPPWWTPSCDSPTYHMLSSVPEGVRQPSSSISSRGGGSWWWHRAGWNVDDPRAARLRRRDAVCPVVVTGATASDRCRPTPTRTWGPRPPAAPRRPRTPVRRHGSASAWNGWLRPSTVWNGPPATSTSSCCPRSRRPCPSPANTAVDIGAAFRLEKLASPAMATMSTRPQVGFPEKDENTSGLRIFSDLRTSLRTRPGCPIARRWLAKCGRTVCSWFISL